MGVDKLTKYIWLVDTLTSRGRLTRRELSELWQRSHLSGGKGLPHRTFFTMRREIEEIFGIEISVSSAWEYYIDTPADPNARALRSWMLDSYAAGSVLEGMREVADCVIVEEVPSARRYLPRVVEAVRARTVLRFTYSSYNRTMPDRDIDFAPYFIRLYHRRWYMIGQRQSDHCIRTYALDRVTDMVNTGTPFVRPEDMTEVRYFDHTIGITSSHSPEQTIKLKVTHHLAKYLRDLPLHPSQREDLFSSYSIITLRLRLTPDLVREILTMGADATVLEPKTLRLMVMQSLKETLSNYEATSEY